MCRCDTAGLSLAPGSLPRGNVAKRASADRPDEWSGACNSPGNPPQSALTSIWESSARVKEIPWPVPNLVVPGPKRPQVRPKNVTGTPGTLGSTPFKAPQPAPRPAK